MSVNLLGLADFLRHVRDTYDLDSEDDDEARDFILLLLKAAGEPNAAREEARGH